ncbi:hypothetical protein NEUTE2DRAFT_95595, partial [Neurospora tetrasperma FGSC 2509]
MSTHTTPHLDRKVLLALVPLASLAASHEGNPNAHGPVNFSEIAESITAATTSTTQPTSAIETSRSSSHSTHLTPSLLHGIIPSVTTTASTSPSPLGADQTRTQTVWANVAQVTEVVTIVKTLTPDHETSATDTSSSSTTSSQNTDPLVIIPVTATVTDLINYNTYTAPASLPPLPPLLPPPGPRVSASSKSSSSPSISDDGPLEIIPVTGTVTDLVDYETVMVPSATATTVVVIPVSSSSTTKSQDVGQMLGQIQGMGEQSSRVVVHPTVSVGDRLTVVVSGGDGRTTITRASPMASAGSAMKGEGGGGKFCKEE